MNLDRELAIYWDSNVEQFDNQCKTAIEQYTKLENSKEEPEIQNLFVEYYSKCKKYSESIRDALQQVSNLKLRICNGIPDALQQFSSFKETVESSVKELDGIVQQICQIILENYTEIELLHNVNEDLLTDETTEKLEKLWQSHQKRMTAHFENVQKAAYETCTQIELSQFKRHQETYVKMKEHYENDIKRKIAWKRVPAIKQVEAGVRELDDILDNMHKTAHIEYIKPWIYLDKRTVIEEDPNPYFMIELDIIWKSFKNRIEDEHKMTQEKYINTDVSVLGEEDREKFIDAETRYLHLLKSADQHIQSKLCEWSQYKELKVYVTEMISKLDGYVATMSELIQIETFKIFDDSKTEEEYKNVIKDWAKELEKIDGKYQRITKYFYDEAHRDLAKWGNKLDVDVVAEIGRINHKFTIYLLDYKNKIGKPLTRPSTKDVQELKEEVFESHQKLHEYIRTLIKEYADLKRVFFR